MSAASVHEREISCSNCGAPVKYLEGEAVLTCAYCGTTSMLAGFDKIVRIEAHYVLPARQQEDQIRAQVKKWMSQGWLKAADLAEKSLIGRCAGMVLPFWVVRAQARTFWSGKNRRSRTVGSGDNKRTETFWEPVSGEFSEETEWTVFAREDQDEVWGLAALNPGTKAVHADWGKFVFGFGLGSQKSGPSQLLENKESFDLEKVRGLNVVNGQISQERAELQARDDLCVRHREQAKNKASQITDCDTTVEVRGVDLIYVPLWDVDYRYQGKTYRVLVNGHSGQVVSGQAPVGKWDKVVILSVFMGILAALFGVVAHFADLPQLWIGSGVTAGIALLYALWTAWFSKS